ncbi:MAG: carbohydrate binding family 9 domain-containing protein [Bacteroidales bacterium]|nr:carbohydrate binding family 9 domain-containing protein [Bacteroidales bacterium]
MRKRFFLTIFTGLMLLVTVSKAQPSVKTATAIRAETPPRIDGSLEDFCWSQASAINSFVQYDPNHSKPESQTTMVYFAYDDEAIYVGAFLFDNYPDSILTQIGTRDDNSLNADWFAVHFDTYLNRLDANTFKVTASGVQSDYMRSDWTYDAVWQSAVNISAVGWVVEMKIPYSALRFPKQEEQVWGLQVQRYIRRKRELSEWAITPKGAPNQQLTWGALYGLNNIQPPLRLALKPYLSTTIQHDQAIADPNARLSYSYGGGADIKYGINQSYTLDMMLWPDFSQVKSDDKVKNLSAFETVYAEQRPFFLESVDLFKKGGLFYSRRIGGQPAEFNHVSSAIDSSESLTDNPVQAKMLNAIKVSGRNNKGLAVGFLNAITGNTYATIEENEGKTRKVLTDPLSNFNIAVLDQVLPNNSSAYLINTSVLRDQNYDRANVTGAGANLLNRKNTFRINLSGACSQVFNYEKTTKNYTKTKGYKYSASFGKISGKFQFNLYRNGMNDRYDDNDLGITHRNDYVQNGVQFNYHLFEPVGKIRSLRAYLNANRETSYTTGENVNSVIQAGYSMTALSYVSNWLNLSWSPFERYDYYDPREQGRYYIRPGYANVSWGFSTDYRKPVALDGNIWFGVDGENYKGVSFRLQPGFRLNDRLNFNYSLAMSLTTNNLGWVEKDNSGTIIYGNRDLESYENILSGQYMFRNNLSVNLRMRHYWYIGAYDRYYSLLENGRLTPNLVYGKNNDFNFNSFNIDLVLNWDFAPGSQLSLVWKNAIQNEDDFITYGFFDNLTQTLQADQLNQLTLKLLYYLDYHTMLKITGLNADDHF